MPTTDDQHSAPRRPADHYRYPRQPRGSFPAHWLLRFGWRRIVFYAPVVAHRCVVSTLTLGKHARAFVGIGAWRDDDRELNIEVGLVLLHLSFNVLVFGPRRDWGDDDDD